ncbi:hypothetical protein BJ944DRAFT_273844 [Cunninghamella echinulata]|nr:hypothetical protein BJ944DRAFT_273844 [Cunninghamella echinulata]
MTIKTTKNDQEKNKNLVTKEIQLHSKINQYGWQPTLRYDKQRLVYQSTTAHSLTFYLDTHIQLKQKDEKKEMNWGLLSIEFMMDDGDDDYKCMKKEDECIEKEINLPLPSWLQHILHHSFWLHEVPSFSMYVHGVSLLYSESIAFLPWWLQWLEQWDKMEQQQQPLYENEKESHRVGLSRSTDLQPLLNGNASPWHHHGSSSQTIINFEHDEDIFNLLEKKKDEQNEDYLLPPPYLLTATTKTATTTTTAAALLKRKNKNKKKKIKDIKVEPKTFFALERTFLAWLQFCALILTISLNLMNFGRDDPISKNCGGAFILLTVCMAIYALIQYVSRAWQLKFKSPLYRFDDIYGPAVLCILLILAMLVNFGLRITHPLHYDDNSTTTFLNNTTLNNDL